MIVSEVYIDEGDTHDGTEAIYMAAVVGVQARWERFDRRWQKLERRKGLTYSHACEIRGKAGRYGQYAHWTETDVRQFVQGADRILEENTMFSLVIRQERETYETHYKNLPLPSRRTKLDTDYALCFRSVLSFVPDYLALLLGPDIEINFILEEHERFGDAHRVFMDIKDGVPEVGRFLGTCIPGGKKKYAGLRGADWQAYKVSIINPKPTPDIAPVLPPIVDPRQAIELPDGGRRAFARMKRDQDVPQTLPEKAPIYIAHNDETMMQQLRYGMLGIVRLNEAMHLDRKREWESKKATSSESSGG